VFDDSAEELISALPYASLSKRGTAIYFPSESEFNLDFLSEWNPIFIWKDGHQDSL